MTNYLARFFRKLILVAIVATSITAPIRSAFASSDIVFAITTPVLNLDPGIDTDSNAATIQFQIMETLVKNNPTTGEIEPLLATSWQVADDQKTWTFKLRPDVKFHDGAAMTSADVVASLKRVMAPGSGLNRSSDLASIEDVRAVDDLTVQIITKGPVSTLLKYLTLNSASVVSKGAIEKFGPSMAWTPVGTGPFKYKDHVAEEKVALVRNDDYWGNKPEIENLTFLTVTEPSTRLAMLKTHQADIIADVPIQDVPSLETDSAVVLLPKATTRVAHFGFNTGKSPFDNPKVRQAISFAIDRQGIIDGIINGAGVITDSIISPSVSGYQAQNLYSYDPEKARQLLAEAGFPSGLSVTVYTPQGRYYMDREITVAAQAQLQQVGINANVEVVDWSSYIAMLQQPQESNKIGMYFLGWESGIDDIEYILDTVFDGSRHPPIGWNTMFYSNPKVDELRKKIKTELDTKARQQLVNDVQKVIMQDAPWVPLFSYKNVAAYRTGIEGIEYMPNDTFRLQNVTFK